MRRIIAFDGIDCIGKSYVINLLNNKLLENDYIPYIFHLTGPNLDFFNETVFGKIPTEFSNGLIQWEKFLQLFSNIDIILKASTRNIVILDRTPYSENIWLKFFGRSNKFNNEQILKNFINEFQLLNENILFVNLDVENKILTNRILLKDIDSLNFIKAFNKLFITKQHEYNEQIQFNESSKIMYMVNVLKEEFNNLFLLLRKNKIDVVTFQNNFESDLKIIIPELLKNFNILI